MNELKTIINLLAKLPGIGKKSAARLAYFLIQNRELSHHLSEEILQLITTIKNCKQCGNLSTEDQCSICADSSRDQEILCVVEEQKDLIAIEESGAFHGYYHILFGNINPLNNIGPDQLKINELFERIKKNKIKEILIATNPTTEGETTFLYLSQKLKVFHVKISKIATGIPLGGSLEYSDKITLSRAIQTKSYLE